MTSESPRVSNFVPQVLERMEKGIGIGPFQTQVPDSNRLSDEAPSQVQRFRCFPY